MFMSSKEEKRVAEKYGIEVKDYLDKKIVECYAIIEEIEKRNEELKKGEM